MTTLVESISFNGTEITLTLRPPNNSDWQALAAAASIRILESYPVVQRVVLKWGSGVFRTSRAHVNSCFIPVVLRLESSLMAEIVNRLRGIHPTTILNYSADFSNSRVMNSDPDVLSPRWRGSYLRGHRLSSNLGSAPSSRHIFMWSCVAGNGGDGGLSTLDRLIIRTVLA
jgi:hypothetical protein